MMIFSFDYFFDNLIAMVAETVIKTLSVFSTMVLGLKSIITSQRICPLLANVYLPP